MTPLTRILAEARWPFVVTLWAVSMASFVTALPGFMATGNVGALIVEWVLLPVVCVSCSGWPYARPRVLADRGSIQSSGWLPAEPSPEIDRARAEWAEHVDR